MAAAEQEDAAKAAHLLPDQAALEVVALAVPEEEANARRAKLGLELVVISLLQLKEVIVAVVMAWVVE